MCFGPCGIPSNDLATISSAAITRLSLSPKCRRAASDGDNGHPSFLMPVIFRTWVNRMGKKRSHAEQTVGKLPEAEVEISEGQTIAQALKKPGITVYSWRVR